MQHGYLTLMAGDRQPVIATEMIVMRWAPGRLEAGIAFEAEGRL